MIKIARDNWYESVSCTINSLIEYMVQEGKMRDAQIDAIKTYLYLKIACGCKPLEELFLQGYFSSINLDELELSATARLYLSANKGAAALFQYACLRNDANEQVSPMLENQIKHFPESVDYERVFHDTFYGVTYTDYLFSLPMGAGKTYLMAAFIYLDLYFAQNEPGNPAFAHNFIIFAPSGLKSSVVPSLKTIQNFDPSWIIPEPAASEIKRLVTFEVLDQGRTTKKSNKTKNPNVQKIAIHQPLSELFGFIAVTNAEKVILDRIVEKNGQISLLEDSDDEKDRQANELRNLIGNLPSLAIFIDEVHHAVSDEIKLRAVVNKWAQNRILNSVIGFSGTPYLEKVEKITITENMFVSSSEITNIVYFYPLINGIGNFLKRPIVKIAEIADSQRIIHSGVRTFLDLYKETVYGDGTLAKLGIYCSTIEKLEEIVYPVVRNIVAEYGLPTSSILKFHKGNKTYPQPTDSQMQFDILDKPISETRIVLLVQIGKEGWDCRSLTGIILSQEGDCPKNMVLQTSCRCLRQVDKDNPETALIYLNESNADKLNEQLQRQHHMSIAQFTQPIHKKSTLRRYDRTAYLRLPQIDFYQFKISYETLNFEPADPNKAISVATIGADAVNSIIKTTDFSMETITTEVDDLEHGIVPTTFYSWVNGIAKGSFGTLDFTDLTAYIDPLYAVYFTITYERNGARFLSSKWDHHVVEANIRKAFCAKRSFSTREELVPEQASLLNIRNFKSEIHTDTPWDFYPEQTTVENIILDDKGKLRVKPEIAFAIKALEETGNMEMAETLRKQNSSHPQKDRSFHYLPYHTDSDFEQKFLKEILTFPEIERLGLEIYYNGDRELTEFKIKCYKSAGGNMQYIGMYTPDFVIIQRRRDLIHKVIIVETKGSIYANDPNFSDRRKFMESEFIWQNNSRFGYDRFEYLYLEDSLSEKTRISTIHAKMCEFFGEKVSV